MAAGDMGSFLRFMFRSRDASQVRHFGRAHQLAVDLHRRTKGPTPALRKLMQAHLDNQASTVEVVDGTDRRR